MDKKLTRDELFNAIDSHFLSSKSVKVYRCHQDYSGNFDELYNAYAEFNTKLCEQGMVDYFLDNVSLDDKKQICHCYFVKFPPSTFLKFEALKAVVFDQLEQNCVVTDKNLGCDFVVFDNAVVMLDVTEQGAIIGGTISSDLSDVNSANKNFDACLVNAKPYLSVIPAEGTMARNIKQKIKQLKNNLKF